MLPTGRATRQGSRKGSRTWWGDTDVTQEAVPRAVDLNTHAAQTERVAARHRERHQQCIQEVCAVAREREENQRANQRDTEWRAQQEQFRTREHIRALESQLGFIDDLSSQDGAALSLSGLDSREQARVGALEARLGFCVLSFSQEEGRLYHDEEEDIVYHLKAELKEHKRRLMKEQRVSDELLRRLQQQSEARKSEEFIAARFADAKPPSQAHLPAPKGEQDIAALISSMSASGRPHYRQLEACWVPGTLAKVHLGSINILACECTRLLATHALSPGQDWMKIGKLLGQGGFGSVHQGYSEQTGRTYAVKTAKPVRIFSACYHSRLEYRTSAVCNFIVLISLRCFVFLLRKSAGSPFIQEHES